MKIIFIANYVYSSHSKNRIVEFKEHGYDVEVYGFDRVNRNRPQINEYDVHVLGIIEDAVYFKRIKKYVQEFRRLTKKYGFDDVIYYLDGFDIALTFIPFNRKAQYIYEEADLVHTYKKYKGLLEYFDKKIIRSSLLTIITSEGFNKYHFGKEKIPNVYIIPNRLQPEIEKCPKVSKAPFDTNHIRFGFVGKPRFKSVYNLIDVICSNYNNHSVEIYGGPIEEEFECLKKHTNCHFHGYFKNPDDLPDIYSKIDLLISTYDIRFENVRYAEPNKIYEAMYFEVPVIVSSGTFLAGKVNKLGIGYNIDALRKEDIISFIENITEESYNNKINRLKAIDKASTINRNDVFFEKLKKML